MTCRIKVRSFFYSFFPLRAMGAHWVAPSPSPGYGCAGAHPRSWWTQAGPTDRGTGGVGNGTRDFPLRGLTAYHLRHHGRHVAKLGFQQHGLSDHLLRNFRKCRLNHRIALRVLDLCGGQVCFDQRRGQVTKVTTVLPKNPS